jgi:predicted nucleic acid-binding protein
VHPLPNLPTGADIFIDANIFIYGLNGSSPQCFALLERCSREEVTGITLFEIVNEATHKFMLAEVVSKAIITRESAADLRKKYADIPGLINYWRETQRILNLNMLFFSTDEQIVKNAQTERLGASLLTNDSMIVSWMREYGIRNVATADHDFERANGITVFGPDDL